MRIPHASRPCVPTQRKTGSEVESGLTMEPKSYFLCCLPLAVQGLEAAPARAVLFDYST